jgi:hypothetical protein
VVQVEEPQAPNRKAVSFGSDEHLIAAAKVQDIKRGHLVLHATAYHVFTLPLGKDWPVGVEQASIFTAIFPQIHDGGMEYVVSIWRRHVALDAFVARKGEKDSLGPPRQQSLRGLT